MNMLNIKPCYKNSKATNYDENYTRLKYLPINGSPLANDLITDYYIKKKKEKVAYGPIHKSLTCMVEKIVLVVVACC